MATVAARPRSRPRPGAARRASASGGGSGRPTPAPPPTKDEIKPKRAPEKAHKPAPAAAAGPPHKAHKPAATEVQPHKAHKPPSAAKTPASGRQASGGAKRCGGAKKTRMTSGAAKPTNGSKSVAAKAASVAAPKAGKALVKAASPNGSSLAGRAGWKLAKVVARRALSSATGDASSLPREGLERAATVVQQVRRKALELTSTSVEADASGRPPIQAAVDAAVPSRVAWQEWISLQWLPEGVDRVLDVERDGDGELTGRLRGQDGHDWEARILEEREEESFAWESIRGSDCAGLITFHALGERLTRIELSLDIRPVSMAQAAALSARMADRRAAADLRRFKARLELINPDSYDDPDDRSS